MRGDKSFAYDLVDGLRPVSCRRVLLCGSAEGKRITRAARFSPVQASQDARVGGSKQGRWVFPRVPKSVERLRWEWWARIMAGEVDATSLGG
jgi:hypothetical protein